MLLEEGPVPALREIALPVRVAFDQRHEGLQLVGVAFLLGQGTEGHQSAQGQARLGCAWALGRSPHIIYRAIFNDKSGAPGSRPRGPAGRAGGVPAHWLFLAGVPLADLPRQAGRGHVPARAAAAAQTGLLAPAAALPGAGPLREVGPDRKPAPASRVVPRVLPGLLRTHGRGAGLEVAGPGRLRAARAGPAASAPRQDGPLPFLPPQIPGPAHGPGNPGDPALLGPPGHPTLPDRVNSIQIAFTGCTFLMQGTRNARCSSRGGKCNTLNSCR